MWTLSLVLVNMAIILLALIEISLIFLLYVIFLGQIIPNWAVTVRRLHDTNKSGWWVLISLIPFGSLVLLIFLATTGIVGDNDYGPDPRMSASQTPSTNASPSPRSPSGSGQQSATTNDASSTSPRTRPVIKMNDQNPEQG
jgi:hypothetical protein